jgi:hypothetical protein
MLYVAFHKESTKILRVIRQGCWNGAVYLQKGACTAAINREAADGKIKAEDYAVLPYDEFSKIEKTEVVTNMMSGKPVVQSVNTPNCCDVSSETYWSM